MESSNKLAWCATFASLYAFELGADTRKAWVVAGAAYPTYADVPPMQALEELLHFALTWPGSHGEVGSDPHPTQMIQVTTPQRRRYG